MYSFVGPDTNELSPFLNISQFSCWWFIKPTSPLIRKMFIFQIDRLKYIEKTVTVFFVKKKKKKKKKKF